MERAKERRLQELEDEALGRHCDLTIIYQERPSRISQLDEEYVIPRTAKTSQEMICKELAKPKPSIETLTILLRNTYGVRSMYLKDKKMSLKDIFDKYPCLYEEKYVSTKLKLQNQNI